MASADRDYTARFNRVVDYIEGHLASALSLDELARVANFSKYHFHRLFQLHHGETLFQFIRRLRLERAAALLTAKPTLPVTQVALECGFDNPSAFSRSFKERFGVSATSWRSGGATPSAEECRASFGIDPTLDVEVLWEQFPIRRGFRDGGPYWEADTAHGVVRRVRIETLPDIEVAYVRHTGRYAADFQLFEALFHALFAWAAPRGLVRFPLDAYCVYHDSNTITDDDKLRVSVCLPVPPDTAVSGEIGRFTISGGAYAVVSTELGPTEYGEAWRWTFGRWLPQSGYEIDDRRRFERYHSEHEHDTVTRERQPVDICVPVVPSG